MFALKSYHRVRTIFLVARLFFFVLPFDLFYLVYFHPLVCACVHAFLVTASSKAIASEADIYVTGCLMRFDLKCHFALHRWTNECTFYLICSFRMEVRALRSPFLFVHTYSGTSIRVSYRNDRFSILFAHFVRALSHRMTEK